MHDKRGIAESLHAYITRARLTVCEVCEVGISLREISQLSKTHTFVVCTSLFVFSPTMLIVRGPKMIYASNMSHCVLCNFIEILLRFFTAAGCLPTNNA